MVHNQTVNAGDNQTLSLEQRANRLAFSPMRDHCFTVRIEKAAPVSWDGPSMRIGEKPGHVCASATISIAVMKSSFSLPLVHSPIASGPATGRQ